MHSPLIYALKDGEPVSIKEVERGLKCGCICPVCGARLEARKGTKNRPHFAHHNESNCAYAYETSLHLAAKDILSKAQSMVIPPVYLSFSHCKKPPEKLSEEKEIPIDRVELEKHFGSIVPDVVVYSKGKRLFVEIFVTHKVDDEKLEKIKKANISTIEIDLRKNREIITVDELSKLLLSNAENKKWLHNAYANDRLESIYKSLERKKVSLLAGAKVGVNCPIPKEERIDLKNIALQWCCIKCKYCWYYDEAEVLCGGKYRLSTIADFDVFPAEPNEVVDNCMIDVFLVEEKKKCQMQISISERPFQEPILGKKVGDTFTLPNVPVTYRIERISRYSN